MRGDCTPFSLLISKYTVALIKYLPMSLATKKMAGRYEKQRKQRHADSQDGSDGEMDLFSRTSKFVSWIEISSMLIWPPAMRSVRRRIKKLPKALDKTFDNTINTMKSNLVGNSSSVEKRDDASRSPKTSEDTVAEAAGMKGMPELHRMKSFQSNASKASHTSKVSEASHKPKKDKEKDEEEWVERPILAPAAPALLDDSDEENDDDVHAFDHPSTYVDQPWIWIPKDSLGLSTFLVQELQDAGVSASDLGAEMGANGIVEVTRNPPDEDWTGGHDA